MPIYEYDCPVCGRFELIQKVSDAPLDECPSCAQKNISTQVAKLMSAPSFHLKGSGWYKTDYSSSNGGNGKSKSDEDSKVKAESTAETKPSSTESAESTTSTPPPTAPPTTTNGTETRVP